MSDDVTPPPSETGTPRAALAGALFGVAFAAVVDEVVFHQLLQWHHFYDRSTTAFGIVSDGILHGVSWVATIASLFMLVGLRRNNRVNWSRWWATALIGAGSFQVYDGLVQHKLLGLHQVRYGVDLAIYDLTWNLAGVLLIVVGSVLYVGTGRRAARARRA